MQPASGNAEPLSGGNGGSSGSTVRSTEDVENTDCRMVPTEGIRDVSTWATCNPGAPIILPRPSRQISDAQRASWAIAREQRAAKKSLLDKAVQDYLAQQTSQMEEIALKHNVTVEYLKGLVGGQTHYYVTNLFATIIMPPASHDLSSRYNIHYKYISMPLQPTGGSCNESHADTPPDFIQTFDITFPPPTPLLDLQPLPLSVLHNKEFENIYSVSIKTFNKIQTRVFQALYTSDENVFIGAPGSGKTVCAEFALLRLWSKQDGSRAVCIEPYQEMVDQHVVEWRHRFSGVQGGKEIVSLTGESSADLRLLEKGDVIICTPTQWDVLSRRWRQRKNVQTVALLIADKIQLVGGEVGPTYAVVILRTRYVSAQTEIKTRIVACGVSLANARDCGEWIGAPSHAIFNFSPSSRPLDMDIHLQSFSIPHHPSLMIAMSKPAYLAIVEYAPTKPVIIFVPSRKQCRLTVADLLVHCTADSDPKRFLNIEEDDLQPHLEHVSDKGLVEYLKDGIGYYHEAMDKQDKRVVERLFQSGAIQVLVISKDMAWSLPVVSYMVIIMGIQYYEGKEHRYVDYPVMDVLQMMGRACRPTEDEQSRCVLMYQQTRKDFYKKFLVGGLPIKSHLPSHLLHYYFLAEIAVKTIENKQDAMDILRWTVFYRRLTQNRNYYNLHNASHQHLSDHPSELVENTSDFEALHAKTFFLLQVHSLCTEFQITSQLTEYLTSSDTW
ncbi:P-loop containing nucleoside triphosphate hydrolase protein [Pisolithus albus]|nr:P-loop containing nucleoside triphosphate hydrolase protein [Pisolithus albus]